MKYQTALIAAAILMAVAANVNVAAATQAHVVYGGAITLVEDPNEVLNGVVDVGDPFWGEYMVQLGGFDVFPEDPDEGAYMDAVFGAQGYLATLPFSQDDMWIGGLCIYNDYGTPAVDTYSVQSGMLISGNTWVATITLTDDTANVFSSDAIPEHPINLGAFDTREFEIKLDSENARIAGTLTYVIPEPSSILFVVCGAFVLSRRRR